MVNLQPSTNPASINLWHFADVEEKRFPGLRLGFPASVEIDPDEFDLFTSQITAGYDEAMRLVWAPHV